MAGRIKWSESKIAEMQKDGYGNGVVENYKPWLHALMFSSKGRVTRILGHKTRRVHHLLSDAEYKTFLGLEWATDVVDIREQFPLDRDLTEGVAQSLGLRHPIYPTTKVPAVMTVDFMVTRVRHGKKFAEGVNVKAAKEIEDARSLQKLEIQRETLDLMGITHHLIVDSFLPDEVLKNIEWIRQGVVQSSEREPHAGYWTGLKNRMTDELRSYTGRATLSNYCNAFDQTNGRREGTGLRVAQMLMHERVIKAPLRTPNLQELPVQTFTITTSLGSLRAMGGI